MSSPYGSPPPSNPVLTAYESFVRETPLVTRYTMTGMFCSYIASWFVNPGSAFDNTALHSLLHFELYRIILAPLVCNEIVSFLFGSFSLFSSGIRLENSIGSTAFLTVLLAIGGLTNIIFLVTCLLLCLITGSNIWLLARSSGIWTIVLGLVAMECSKAPSGSTRRFIFASVPTLYYPLAILAFFSLMSKQIRLSYVISVLVGYAFGFNKLTFLQPSTNRCSSWENGILSNFTQRPGWITGHSASGLSAWETLPTFQVRSIILQFQNYPCFIESFLIPLTIFQTTDLFIHWNSVLKYNILNYFLNGNNDNIKGWGRMDTNSNFPKRSTIIIISTTNSTNTNSNIWIQCREIIRRR